MYLLYHLSIRFQDRHTLLIHELSESSFLDSHVLSGGDQFGFPIVEVF